MVRLSGLFFLLPFSLAARIDGGREPRSIQKRPSVDVRNQQAQDAPILRLPMSRRPPKLTTTPPTVTRHKKQSLAFQHSSLRHTSSTSSAKPTSTPIAANTTAYFKDAAYGIKVWIGTYGQEVTLDFDTGSSETWVSPPCSEWAQYPEYEDLCRLLGTYVPEQSSTALEADCPASWIMYGSGSVYIKYYTDNIQFTDPYANTASTGWTFDSPSLYNVQFGLATDATNMPSGIFGAAYGGLYNQDYPSIIDEMHNQSLIASKDFSVALGSVGKEDGEVVFGGIDLAKFSGPLHEYEISHQLPKAVDGYYRYWVNLSSIGITEPDSCVTVPLTPKGFSERFLPDTGTSLTYMPTDAFNGILKTFPDANLTYGYGYVVGCSHRERKGTIDYTFPDGFTVHVPFSEFIFVIPPGPSTGPEETCIIGAVPTDELFILGDTFLRSVYAVFSQEHHKIYFGHYKDCGTNVVPSRGLKNKGLKGDCPVEDRDHEPKQGDQHYGYPTTPAAGSCTSYSTAPHPKSTSHTTSDDFWTEAFNNPGLLRPMIQTGARQVVTSTAAKATPTSLDKTPQRPIPNLPWSGNITATFLSTGHVASTGFHPLSTGTSSPKNGSVSSTLSFPSVTKSNTTIPGSTTGLKKSSSLTSSTRIDDVSTSSKTFSRATAKSSFLTPFPQPTISSTSCTTSTHETSLSTTWLDVSTSSSSYNWWTISSSDTSEPSVVTIPVQPDETIIVRLESTTYTIVDGSTLSGGSDSGPTSTEITSSSLIISSQGWDTSISCDSFTFTKATSTSSSISSTKKKTRSTSTGTRSSSSSSSHKKNKTTTTSSSSTSTDWDFPTSTSGSSTMGDKYLTSWRWDPTGTSDFDPFFTSSSSSGYADETSISDTRTNDFDPSSHSTSSSSAESTSSRLMSFSISSDSTWDWPTSTEASSSSETVEPSRTIESDRWPTSSSSSVWSTSSEVSSSTSETIESDWWPTSSSSSSTSSSTKRTKSTTKTKTSSTSSFSESSSISSASSSFTWTSETSESGFSSWSFTESGSSASVASEFSRAIQSIQTGSASDSSSASEKTPNPLSFSEIFPWPSGSFSADWTSTKSTGWPILSTPSSFLHRTVSTSTSRIAFATASVSTSGRGGSGDNGGGFDATVTVTGTVTTMVTVFVTHNHKTTQTPGIVPRDKVMTITEACHVGVGEPNADCIMKTWKISTKAHIPVTVSSGRPGLPGADADALPLGRVVRRHGDEGFKKVGRGVVGSGDDDGHDSGYESTFEAGSESGQKAAEDGSSPDY